MSDSLSQHCPNCEEQALEIVGLKAQLHIVLDREADTQCRHDAKVEAQAAEIAWLRKQIDSMIGSMADITALAMPAQFIIIDRGETK
jgi:hypothetical protein